MDSDAIRKLLDEATPGPWGISGKQTVRSIRFGKLFDWIAKTYWSNGPANARLIAAAPDLAAEVARLTQERDDALRRAMDWQGNYEALALTIIGNTGASAILGAEKLRADRDRLSGLLDEARAALVTIDALDPEAMISALSDAAARGLVLRMGEIARAALKETTDGQ